MKYAFSIYSLSIFISTFSTQANARSITNLRQSDAITAVAEFLYDVGEDVQATTRLTDKKIIIKNLYNSQSLSIPYWFLRCLNPIILLPNFTYQQLSCFTLFVITKRFFRNDKKRAGIKI